MPHRHKNDVAVLVRMPRSLRGQLAEAAALQDRSTASLLRVLARDYLGCGKGQQR